MEDIETRLSDIASNSHQKDKGQPYLDLLSTLLSSAPSSPDALLAFGQHFVNNTTMTLGAGRRALEAYITALSGGSGFDKNVALGNTSSDLSEEEINHWSQVGATALQGEEEEEVRLKVVEGVLSGGVQAGWSDEQVVVLRFLLSHLLQKEEDWLGAARALTQIPLDGASRSASDEDKFKVYIQIIRLLLECQEWGQAQTYFTRAALLYPTAQDKESRLSYRLSQARIFDFSARFNEAAQKYHEVSFDPNVAEEDRLRMLQAAVTTSILAPAGPQRARILAPINRDDRVHNSLPPYLGTMLRKMLLEYIVRPSEVKEFEATLEEHQRATVEGGGTVLERAVRDHNVGACAKVYDNISFDALGSILNVDGEAAQLIARKMIEQGRLRAWIDQPLNLLYFESRSPDTDADAQGTAGGLGVEREEKPVEPVSWTERWDERIRETSIKVESIAAAIQAKAA